MPLRPSSFALMRDDSGNLYGELTDGHSRSVGLHFRHGDGKLTAKELNTPVDYRAVGPEQKLPTYKFRNAGKGHVSSNKYINPELRSRGTSFTRSTVC